MNTTRHTPGPWWSSKPGNLHQIYSHGDDMVAQVAMQDTQMDGGRNPEIEAANALLIAAAPELLAVARMIVSFARNTRENAESTNLLYSAADAARAAIAKATSSTT